MTKVAKSVVGVHTHTTNLIKEKIKHKAISLYAYLTKQ